MKSFVRAFRVDHLALNALYPGKAFIYSHMGLASAMAWILFLIIAALTGVDFAARKTGVYYETD